MNEKLETKWSDECQVTFWKYSDTEMTKTSNFSLSPSIPFADKANDVIVLKVLVGLSGELPNSIQLLDEEALQLNFVSIYGYLNKNGTGEKLCLDTNCKLYDDETELDNHIQVVILTIKRTFVYMHLYIA